jgi:hypothetical protein
VIYSFYFLSLQNCRAGWVPWRVLSPPDGLFKWNVDEIRGRNRRLQTAFALKAGQIIRFGGFERLNRPAKERLRPPSGFHFVRFDGSRVHYRRSLVYLAGWQRNLFSLVLALIK